MCCLKLISGGTSYCSVASLSLLSSGNDLHDEHETVRWLAQRQIGGFQGRPGKLEDVCYSFWIGGALSVRSLSLFLPNAEVEELIKRFLAIML